MCPNSCQIQAVDRRSIILKEILLIEIFNEKFNMAWDYLYSETCIFQVPTCPNNMFDLHFFSELRKVQLLICTSKDFGGTPKEHSIV